MASTSFGKRKPSILVRWVDDKDKIFEFDDDKSFGDMKVAIAKVFGTWKGSYVLHWVDQDDWSKTPLKDDSGTLKGNGKSVWDGNGHLAVVDTSKK